jgi:hypothetical protein
MRNGARLRSDYYRDMAAHFRALAQIEPLTSLRRHLRRLAAQHDELAADIETPATDEQHTPSAGVEG